MHFLAKYVIYLTIFFSCNFAYSQKSSIFCPLAPKTAAIDGGIISYLEGGKGEPILLLHGLFAQKEQWMEVGCALAIKGFDVVIPDLPGYGLSSGYAISTYALESQVKILQHFMKKISGRNFPIAGSSMGGTIAALYADEFPNEIKSLAFIGAPMGIVGWSPQIRHAIFEGVNPFIPINKEQLDLEMSLLFLKTPIIDEAVKLKLIKEYVINNRHYQQTWDIVNFYGTSLNRLPAQSVRTIIFWGEHDGIFNISGIELLKKHFPYSQTYKFSNAAHLLMLEQPSMVVDIYSNFLKH